MQNSIELKFGLGLSSVVV